MDFLLAFILCFFAFPVFGDNTSSKPRSCSDVRQFYSSKGFSVSGVPQAEISGEHLRVCTQGFTCCTSAMEDSLGSLSKREFESRVKEAGRSLQSSLNGQFKNFDSYFLEQLDGSERSLQEMFLTIYGAQYSPNAHIYRDLYAELRLYHRGASVNLEEVLNDFWVRLLERLFKLYNPQYAIGDEYLECVSKQTETLRPFGDVPRDLKLKATRAFIAARTFVQGLTVAGDVVRKVSQVPLSPECVRAIMKLMYCPHCRMMAPIKPCTNYCSNVIKGCLANQADLDPEWQNLIDALLQVTSRFTGESSVDMLIYSIPLRISEAMLTMQENIEVFNSKVFQACGTPHLSPTRSSQPEEARKFANTGSESETQPAASIKLEKLVSDVTSKLREMQQYWVQLPNALCNDRVTAGAANEDKCWNGMGKARYLPEVMGDGLASQINNPEVEIDITKPDMTIRQQIMQLKIMTNRLKNAFNGNDVDFQDATDDVSGSGSGMCSDETCVRNPRVIIPNTDQPSLFAYPAENEKVHSTGNRIHPTAALLLSLATLSLWR